MNQYDLTSAIDRAKDFLQAIGYMSPEQRRLAFDVVDRGMQEYERPAYLEQIGVSKNANT